MDIRKGFCQIRKLMRPALCCCSPCLVAPRIVVGRFASLVVVHFALLFATCFALLYVVICMGCYSLLTCIATI